MRGFAAIAAVFVLVVLGMMGAVLVTVSSAQHRGSAFDAQGIRAYQAARTGIEYGAHQALQNSLCPTDPETIGFPGPNLTSFNATVSCTSTTVSEGGTNNLVIYQISATACNRSSCPDTPDGAYVERQLRVTVVSQAP